MWCVPQSVFSLVLSLVLDDFVACVCALINMTCLICHCQFAQLNLLLLLLILQVHTTVQYIISSFSPAYCH